MRISRIGHIYRAILLDLEQTQPCTDPVLTILHTDLVLLRLRGGEHSARVHTIAADDRAFIETLRVIRIEAEILRRLVDDAIGRRVRAAVHV